MNICEGLIRTAQWFPDQTAVVFEAQSISYAQLHAWSRAAAERLVETGVRPGDRVALMLPNTPAFIVWYYAVLRLGAIAVSVSTRLTASEVSYVVLDCDAHTLVTLPSELPDLESHLSTDVTTRINTSPLADECQVQPSPEAAAGQFEFVDMHPQAAALILYTSGTTGFAKGATLSHGNVHSNVCAFNHLCGMQRRDRILLAVPLFHCFGQNALLNSAVHVGATLVVQSHFDLNESRRLLVEQRVTQLYGVPTMFQLLHDRCDPADLATVEYCFSAAAPLSLPLSQAWQEKFGMPLYEGYGLTETSPFASYNHRLRFTPGSIGTPVDSVEMKIVDPATGAVCAPGVLGEIAIRGPNVMLGYWNRPEETAAAIRDGWFYSGDIGRQESDGFFYIVDRVKDMITIGGMKVFPAEVERVLLDHPSMADVAVVGIPDPVFGEQVIAFAVLRQEPAAATDSLLHDLTQFAKRHLANFKVPRRFIPIPELPRNPAGKVLKTRLRDQAMSEDASDETSITAQQRKPRCGVVSSRGSRITPECGS